MIELENVHKGFGGNPVLRGLTLTVPRGKVLALVGRSGCGKSVLLKHMAGLIRPDQGRVRVDGRELQGLGSRERSALLARFGFLFQGGALFDSLSVYDNVAFPLREKTRLGEAVIRKRVLEELAHVGLTGSEGKFPSQLSGGMVKRAALARALVMDPEIMFFDEPTTGLDPVMGTAILDLIDAFHARLGFTGVVVTHEIPRVLGIVDRVAMLHEGVLTFEGSPETFLASQNPHVREFLDKGTCDRFGRGRGQNQGDDA